MDLHAALILNSQLPSSSHTASPSLSRSPRSADVSCIFPACLPVVILRHHLTQKICCSGHEKHKLNSGKNNLFTLQIGLPRCEEKGLICTTLSNQRENF